MILLKVTEFVLVKLSFEKPNQVPILTPYDFHTNHARTQRQAEQNNRSLPAAREIMIL